MVGPGSGGLETGPEGEERLAPADMYGRPGSQPKLRFPMFMIATDIDCKILGFYLSDKNAASQEEGTNDELAAPPSKERGCSQGAST